MTHPGKELLELVRELHRKKTKSNVKWIKVPTFAVSDILAYVDGIENENDRLWQALSWINDADPGLVDGAEERFGLDLIRAALKQEG